jgi:hypothetical protein
MYKVVSYLQENPQSMGKCFRQSDLLWFDNLNYTRQAVICLPQQLGDGAAIVSRLMSNADEIGTMLSSYYVPAKVERLVVLLKEHVNLAGQAVMGDQGDSSMVQQQWRSVGDDLTSHMESMNYYYWPKVKTYPLWIQHIDLANDQIMARRDSEFYKDIEAFDQQNEVIREFSYVFSKGIIYQNIEMFSEQV